MILCCWSSLLMGAPASQQLMLLQPVHHRLHVLCQGDDVMAGHHNGLLYFCMGQLQKGYCGEKPCYSEAEILVLRVICVMNSMKMQWWADVAVLCMWTVACVRGRFAVGDLSGSGNPLSCDLPFSVFWNKTSLRFFTCWFQSVFLEPPSWFFISASGESSQQPADIYLLFSAHSFSISSNKFPPTWLASIFESPSNILNPAIIRRLRDNA